MVGAFNPIETAQDPRFQFEADVAGVAFLPHAKQNPFSSTEKRGVLTWSASVSPAPTGWQQAIELMPGKIEIFMSSHGDPGYEPCRRADATTMLPHFSLSPLIASQQSTWQRG